MDLLRLFAGAYDLALPASCGGCGRPGVSWCACCRSWVGGQLGRDGAHQAWPDPVPEGFPPTWVAAPYDGPLRRALTHYKDEGRRDLARPLAVLLAVPLAAAVLDACRLGDPVVVVPVPTTRSARRRRGDAPLEELTRAAARLVGVEISPTALVVRRRVADQAGLGAQARAANLGGAFVAGPEVGGRQVVLVDDIVTTGATLAEAARAVRAAGAEGVRGACVAATQRRLRTGACAPARVGGTGRPPDSL